MEGRKVKQTKLKEKEGEGTEEHEEEEKVKPPTREEAFQRQVSIFHHIFLLLVMVRLVMTTSKHGVIFRTRSVVD